MYAINLHIYFEILNLIKPYEHKKSSVTSLTHVSTLQNKPHVICIQETWLKPQWDFVIYGYKEIRNDRKDRSGGGVAIFCRMELILGANKNY